MGKVPSSLTVLSFTNRKTNSILRVVVCVFFKYYGFKWNLKLLFSFLLSNVTVSPLHMLLISFICKPFLSTLKCRSSQSQGHWAHMLLYLIGLGYNLVTVRFFFSSFNVWVQAFNTFHQTITYNWSHKTHSSLAWSLTL